MKDLKSLLFEEGPHGEILFGDEREMPERNTDDESELARKLLQHFNGHKSPKITQAMQHFLNLEKQGNYQDFLTVPSKYQYAYRVLFDVPRSTLFEIVNDSKPEKLEYGEIGMSEAGMYFEIKEYSSWTVDKKGLQAVAVNLGRNTSRYSVVLEAQINGKGNNFVLNPDALIDTEFDLYDDEREIISIGNVACDRVWYLQGGSFRDLIDHVKEKMR